MELHDLSLRDKGTFSEYLNFASHKLSVYAFENIYIWKALFEIKWAIIEGSLCVFFKDKIGAFLYLAPLAKKIKAGAVKEVFEILDKFNQNKEISRIENVEEGSLKFYEALGLECVHKSSDYLCLRQELAELSGDKFKSKRAGFNYFSKNYDFAYLVYRGEDKSGCLELYNLWARERSSNQKDALYQWMLKDNLSALRLLLDNYRDLKCTGRIVKIGSKVKAFTFGFKLNQETFCILYEITDLSIKGLAQFIFREFCRELKDYKYINIMDDSGLENLKRVKLSYHPVRLVPAYIVKRR
ncbi:MAG: phosphatidylglycerol lysyltransferase domain-containing protein [Candidatus Omnitrophota bacterium]|jgi:hypothetical protein